MAELPFVITSCEEDCECSFPKPKPSLVLQTSLHDREGHTDTAELSLYFLCLHDPIDPIDHVNSAHVLFIS